MACPRLFKKLFQNDGASRMLRPDIIPASQDITVSSITLNQFADAGEYIVTGSKTTADGYPEDTTDDIYLKIITTTDGTTQYYLHNGKMLARYKEASSDTWSEWLEFGKNYDDVLEPGTTIYLNASTGDDTLDYGRGLSEDKPFKTLAAALDYGLNKFYRNNTFLTFQFAAGTYGDATKAISLSQLRNVQFKGTGPDTIIQCVCLDILSSQNIQLFNVHFKFYSENCYIMRVMYNTTLRFLDYVGLQLMCTAGTGRMVEINVGSVVAGAYSKYSEQGRKLYISNGGSNSYMVAFLITGGSKLVLPTTDLTLAGNPLTAIAKLEGGSHINVTWGTNTITATPESLYNLTQNSVGISSGTAVSSSSTPVTVDDSSTYTGSAKSPNYNAAIRVNDVTNWESTAQMHNNIYRGANLLDGHFSSIADIMTAVRKGDFSDIYVGDYIPASFSCSIDTSVTSTNFRIAAINLLNARSGAWGSTSPNLCIVPDKLGSAYMNSTNTTAGGYVGSYMYKTVLPAYYKALAGSSGKPFYGYIKTTTERLSNGIDTAKSCGGFSGWTGATSSKSDYTNQNLVLLNEPEVYGCKHWSSSEWDAETIPVQLPMFRLNPNTITNNGTTLGWLRAVAGSTYFCYVNETLCGNSHGASNVNAVRPRFFIS